MNDDRTGLADALIRLGKDRDPEAWRLLVERCGPASERLARRLTSHGDLAQDAVQEAWLQIRDGARNFTPRGEDPDAGAWGWIMRVTANATLQLARRQRRTSTVQVTMCDRAEPDHVHPDPLLVNALHQALAALPEAQRSAVVLHHVVGLDFNAIGAATGCRPETAKMRAHRGIAYLRGQVSKSGVLVPSLGVAGALTDVPACEPLGQTLIAPLMTSHANGVLSHTSIFGGVSMAIQVGIAFASVLVLVAGGYALALERAADGGAPVHQDDRQVVLVTPMSVAAPDAEFMVYLDSERYSFDGTTSWRDIFERLWPVYADPTYFMTGADLIKPVPKTLKNERQVLDEFVKITGATWRLRGQQIELLPSALSQSLSRPVDGVSLEAMNWDAWRTWIATNTGMRVSWIHEKANEPPDAVYRIQPGMATVESIIQGLAVTWEASVYIDVSAGWIELQHREIQPGMEPARPVTKGTLVLNPPPVAILDREITLHLRDVPLADAMRKLQEQAHIPVECFSDALRNVPITLVVEDMKIRYVASYMGKLAGVEPTFLPDRIRFGSAVETKPITEPEQAPLLPESHF